MSYIPLSRADLASAKAYTISANRTTTGTEIIRCVDSLDIILNLSPKDRETVVVYLATASTVNIIGDIRIYSSTNYYNIAEFNIGEFGGSTLTFNTVNATAHLMFVRDFEEWVAI
tara:strand:+ start:1228 stop:1572 length:345 start_codon:yes stop_codon:yes gene_type:complete